jgi:hypothetical protein
MTMGKIVICKCCDKEVKFSMVVEAGWFNTKNEGYVCEDCVKQWAHDIINMA